MKAPLFGEGLSCCLVMYLSTPYHRHTLDWNQVPTLEYQLAFPVSDKGGWHQVQSYVEQLATQCTLVPLKPPVQSLSITEATVLNSEQLVYPVILWRWPVPHVLAVHFIESPKN